MERREASVPRHGTRRASLGADVAPRPRDKEQVRLSALRPPSFGVGREHKDTTRAQKRAAGTKKTALFDIVNEDTANGALREPRLARVVRAPLSRVPGEHSETRDLAWISHTN